MAEEQDGYIALGTENTSYVSVGKHVKDLLEAKARELGQRRTAVYKAYGTWTGSPLKVETLKEMVKEVEEAGVKEISPLELFFRSGMDGQLKVGWVKEAIMKMVNAGDVTSERFQKATDLLNRITSGQAVKSSDFEPFRPEAKPEKEKAKGKGKAQKEEAPAEEEAEVEEEEAEEAGEEPEAAEVPDYRSMEFKDMKALVTDLGLKVAGKRKKDFLKALDAHFGQ